MSLITPLDWLVIALYLAGTVALGLWYGGRQDNTEDYFTGGGKMAGHWQSLLVGLSIAATLFSGISFLAYPSIVFQHGLAVVIGLLSFPICWLLMRFIFIRRYLADAKVEPYRIIEERFGVGVRSTAAVMFLLLRVGWMSALIYAPTIAILGAADLGPEWFWVIALTIGVSSTVYTTLGGIRGVIVTDALQFVVIFGALLLVIAVIFFKLPVPLSEGWGQLRNPGDLKCFAGQPILASPSLFGAWSSGLLWRTSPHTWQIRCRCNATCHAAIQTQQTVPFPSILSEPAS